MLADAGYDVSSLLLQAMGNRKKWIASVHFADLKKEDMRHVGKAGYYLPAPQQKGEVSVLEITDAAQLCQHWENEQEQPRMQPKIVTVEGIVADLLKSWAGQRPGMMKGFRPGVMEIAGPMPTDAEKKKLFSYQFDFCVQAVQEADVFHSQPVINGQQRRIQPFHRQAHEWLATYDGNFKRRVWATAQTMELTKRGAASGTQIPMHAEFDNGIDLLDFYYTRGYNPADYGDTYLAGKMEAYSKARKASESVTKTK